MVVVAAVTARVIGRAALGDEPFLSLPPFTVEHVVQYRCSPFSGCWPVSWVSSSPASSI